MGCGASAGKAESPTTESTSADDNATKSAYSAGATAPKDTKQDARPLQQSETDASYYSTMDDMSSCSSSELEDVINEPKKEPKSSNSLLGGHKRKSDVNKGEAIKNCSDKNFSDIRYDGEKHWVTLEAKSLKKNREVARDIRMLTMLKSRTAAAQFIAHPGRDRIIDFLETDCHPGTAGTLAKITMELIQPFGFDLMCLMIKRYKTGQAFAVTSVAHYFYQISEGLDYMHTVGIVHGDVKLQNVLVTSTGDVKIIDFGYATCLGEFGRFPPAEYIAPEARGKKIRADPTIDIYSVGIIAGQLSLVLDDRDKAPIMETRQKLCKLDPKMRPPLKAVLQEAWLASRFGSTLDTQESKGQIARFRMKGFAMLVKEEVLKLGDTIGKAKLMQQGIQVLYVDRRNSPGAQTHTGVGLEIVPGPDTEIRLGDWIYFGQVGGESKLFLDAIRIAMNPDLNDPYVFPVHLSFSEIELPSEVDGYVLGPDIPPLREQYEKLPEPPKGFLNLRKLQQINLGGVRRKGEVLAFPGPAFVLKAGDIGLFVQAVDMNGHLTETHDLQAIPDMFRAAVKASA